MGKTSPTSRSLAYLKPSALTVSVVERWNAHAKIRQDLFGFIDLLALYPLTIIGIQATTRSNVPARIKKSLAEPRLAMWLRAGGKYEVHGWSKKGGKKTWILKRVTIGLRGGVPRVMLEEEIEYGV
jgi:hypothetical protein